MACYWWEPSSLRDSSSRAVHPILAFGERAVMEVAQYFVYSFFGLGGLIVMLMWKRSRYLGTVWICGFWWHYLGTCSHRWSLPWSEDLDSPNEHQRFSSIKYLTWYQVLSWHAVVQIMASLAQVKFWKKCLRVLSHVASWSAWAGTTLNRYPIFKEVAIQGYLWQWQR